MSEFNGGSEGSKKRLHLGKIPRLGVRGEEGGEKDWNVRI